MSSLDGRISRLEAESPSIAQALEAAEIDARLQRFVSRLSSEDRRFYTESLERFKASGCGDLEAFTKEEVDRLIDMHREHGGFPPRCR